MLKQCLPASQLANLFFLMRKLSDTINLPPTSIKL